MARSEELIVEEVDGQVLIYDERTNEAHCLSHAAAAVWRACDGRRSHEQLAAELEIGADTVMHALDELDACGLLTGREDPGVTRREAATRFAKIGTAAAAVPLIYSIVGPLPEAAASVTPTFCAQFSGTSCGTNSTGCSGQAGCCCYQFIGGATPPSICNGNKNHCCLTPTFACANGGKSSACSTGTTSPC